MLLLGLTLTVTACATPLDDVFLPGNDSLLIGLPDPANPNNIIEADPIIRTPSQQQAAITTFNAFPAGTLNSAAGVIIILNPGNHVVAAKMAALNLAVGNLGALDNWSSSLFHGIMGITGTDTIGFGGSNFIDSFGIPGAPVQFYVQNYKHTGINANQFITPQGLPLSRFSWILLQSKKSRNKSARFRNR